MDRCPQDKPWQGTEDPPGQTRETGRADGTGRIAAMEPISDARLAYALSPEGLREAAGKCARGKMWKPSVTSWALNRQKRCSDLSMRLLSGEYGFPEPHHFELSRPKRRDCSAPTFEDRVFQRSLIDNVVYEDMTRSLIPSNCACRRGMGTDRSRDLLVRDLRRHWHRYGTDGGVMLLDVAGYYPNKPHALAKEVFRSRLPPDVYAYVEASLDAQRARAAHNDGDGFGPRGYEAGSELMQVAGICDLDGMDHYIKQDLRAVAYGRYMDDFYVVDSDLEYLRCAMESIADYLGSLGYALNVKKSRIQPLTEPIPWLGYTYRLTESGKVVVRLKSEKWREHTRRLRRMRRAFDEGRMSREDVDEVYESYLKELTGRHVTRKQIVKFEKFYKELWRA